MSEGLNRVTLLGNLGADPELRMTQGGQAVLKLRMATTESYLDQSNTRQERTEWHSVTVWGKRGEGLSRHLSKGSRILVEGSIRTSSYEKDGEKRYRTEVVATNVVFAGGKSDSDTAAPRQGGQRAPAHRQDDVDGGGGGALPQDADDEIPFIVDATTHFGAARV